MIPRCSYFWNLFYLVFSRLPGSVIRCLKLIMGKLAVFNTSSIVCVPFSFLQVFPLCTCYLFYSCFTSCSSWLFFVFQAFFFSICFSGLEASIEIAVSSEVFLSHVQSKIFIRGIFHSEFLISNISSWFQFLPLYLYCLSILACCLFYHWNP